jgi:hypothetical protein
LAFHAQPLFSIFAARVAAKLRLTRLHNAAWQRKFERRIAALQYRISPDAPFISVRSAFGGLGIYRAEALSSAWYGSRDQQGRAVCEHVVFHRQLRARGFGLYISPALLNEAPPEHLGKCSGRQFPPATKPGPALANESGAQV